MLRLLRQIGFRQLRASWGRTILVVAGIATGVALIVAINIINTSVLANFRNTIELIAGPAALEVTLGFGEIGFDESAVNIVRVDPDVIAAVPLVRGTISVAENSRETLQLFGVDFTAEEDLQRYRVRTADRQEVLRELADPRSILLVATFAKRHGLRLKETVRLSTPQGIGDFTVRGLLETEGLAAVFGGQLAVMDLPAAQLVLQKQGRIDQIDLVLRGGIEVEAVQQRLEKALPQALSVARPAQRGKEYERILRSFQAMLMGLSLLCLVVGVYIVYSTTSTGAIHRALVMAGLRVAGARASQLFRLLMFEALILGTMGALLGIPSGVILARLLTGMVSDSMGIIFQLRFPVQTLAVDVSHQVMIGILGIVATLFASYFAARHVTTLEPLEVMRADLRSLASRRTAPRLVVWWLVLVLISAAALVVEVRFKSIAWGNFGSTLWNASVLVIAIPFVSWSAGMLSRILPRIFGVEGRLAAESVFRSPTRTGITVAAVALVLIVAVTVSSLTLSFRRSVSSYYEEGGFLLGDLVVSAVATEGGWLETPIPQELATEIHRIPGVQSVETARAVPGQLYRGQRITLVALSDGLLQTSRYGPQWYSQGDPAAASEALVAGEGVNVAVALADRFGLRVGERIIIDTPTGPLNLPIVGIVRDYMSDRGTVTFNRRLLAEHWGDTTVNRVNVFLEQGASPEAVRRRIAKRFGNSYRLKILLPSEVIAYHSAAIDRAFAFTDAIRLLIIIVTIAGVFDLLLAAIWERRRELALWRLIGARERAVRRSVIIESATIGALGAVLGIPVGFVTAWIWIGINFRYLLGYHLEYHLALGATVWHIALVMAATVLAGYAAGRYATSLSVLDGIQAQ